jgi:FMN reductase
MTNLAIVTGGLREPSSTRLLAARIDAAVRAELTEQGVAAASTFVELRPLGRAIMDALLTGFAGSDLEAAFETVGSADGLIAVTPAFNASYSGLFKSFFDVFEDAALLDKPVLLAATGGTARHSLVLDHALRPLFSYLHAVVVPTGVFAASEDFGSNDEGHLDKRIRRAAGELAGLLGVDAEQVADVRRTVEDEFADPTPFEELLRRAGGGPRP